MYNLNSCNGETTIAYSIRRLGVLGTASCFSDKGFMSNQGNYIVPNFLQQDITVDYLAATTHQAAAATLLCVSEPDPYISAEVRRDADRARKQVGLAVMRRQIEQPVKHDWWCKSRLTQAFVYCFRTRAGGVYPPRH